MGYSTCRMEGCGTDFLKWRLESVLQTSGNHTARPPWETYTTVLETRFQWIVKAGGAMQILFRMWNSGPALHPYSVTRRVMGVCPLSASVLWTWRRLMTMSLGIMWNVLWENMVQGQCYKPSSSYMTRVRGVSVFLTGSQTHLQSVLGTDRVVPIHQFCLWFLCIGFKDKGVGGCPVWGHRNCFPALCWWCGSLGFIRHWPSAHTGAVCSRMWRWDESQHLQVMIFWEWQIFCFGRELLAQVKSSGILGSCPLM